MSEILKTEFNTETEVEEPRSLEEIKKDLESYGLSGLEGRMEHGLDPAAMLAISEVRTVIKEIADKNQIDLDKLDDLTKEMHQGGIWKNAELFSDDNNSEAKVWLALAYETEEKNSETEVLDEAGFRADLKRITEKVKEFNQDYQKLLTAAEEEIKQAQGQYEKIDGVAFQEGEYPFLNMSIGGEKAGVWKDGELYFVAADKLDYDLLKKQGYQTEEREDRGRKVTFWMKDGQDVIKQLYDGFAIVLNADQKLALDLAKTGQ